MLVSMEERKAFWGYERLQKWYRKNLGEEWITIVLDYFEDKDKAEGTTHQRKDMGAYLLRMHQLQLLLIMEKTGWKRDENGKPVPPNKPE